MAGYRNIVTDGDPLLRQPCAQVLRFGDTLRNLMDDMRITLYHSNGVGLAAPQVGVSKRVIVVDDREAPFVEMVNPRIVESSGCEEDVEACLSVPDRAGWVRRATKIKVEYQDRFGKNHTLKASGYQARVHQHEIDHLDGVLFTDIMTEEYVPEQDEKGRTKKVKPRRPEEQEKR